SMVLLARFSAVKQENKPAEGMFGHRRIFNLAQRIQANTQVLPDVINWPRNHQKFSQKGQLVLYTGFLPLWDSLLYSYDLNLKIGLQAILEALNSIEIIPAIPRNQKDSGHDLLYGGDEENFLSLASYNNKVFKDAGAERIIVVSPEDYHVLKNVYPSYLDDFNFDVVFWTDFLVQNQFIENIYRQSFFEVDITCSYHDPCKLGRLSGIYESPRIILENIPGVKLVELDNTRELAPCCGVSAFIGCNDGTLHIRKERLAEAKRLGCQYLITTCPSCVTHFKCAQGAVLDAVHSTAAQGGANAANTTMQVMELATFMGARLFRFD
ncbi:MAG: (Fe-S)-binding protein, partial [Promethearchaeota archaeon]